MSLLAPALLGHPFLNKPEDLSPEEKKLRDKRMPRAALRNHKYSSFKHLFDSKNDQALMNCCACNHEVFAELLSYFDPYFKRYTFDSRTGKIRKLKMTRRGKVVGKKRDLDSVGCLGMVLY